VYFLSNQTNLREILSLSLSLCVFTAPIYFTIFLGKSTALVVLSSSTNPFSPTFTLQNGERERATHFYSLHYSRRSLLAFLVIFPIISYHGFASFRSTSQESTIEVSELQLNFSLIFKFIFKIVLIIIIF